VLTPEETRCICPPQSPAPRLCRAAHAAPARRGLGHRLPAEPLNPKERIDAIYGHIKEAASTVATQDELTSFVSAEMDTFLDYEAFSARTLKTSWANLTPEQKATFIERFKRLIIKTYAKKFQPKSEFSIEYRGDIAFTNEAKTDASVKTTVRGSKKDVAADVDYLLSWVEVGGKRSWRTYDIIVDEVSMALNWRQQFEKIIAKEGFDSLISKINRSMPDAER
jgi:phospholipid transport system substrate-binding protein